MRKILTISYEESNDLNIAVMCVAECNLHSTTVLKMIIGKKARQLYEELTTGQNVIIKTEDDKE